MTLKSLSSTERSKNLFFQISSSFLIKGLLFVITYAQFPIFNKFLNKEEFGLWMTFISIYSWFILFDFGIGHGLKNILTEKISNDNKTELKKYSSSGIAGTLVIAILFIIIFELLKLDLFTSNILNTNTTQDFLKICINYTFYSCIILFLHNTLSSFIYSVQKASYANYISLAVNTSLIILVLYVESNKSRSTFNNPLVLLSQVNFFCYALFFVIICIFFFRKYSVFIPNIKSITFQTFKEVLSKGTQFFYIQISILVLYPIDSFIIANLISASTAGDYNVIIKIYSILLVIGAIINQTSWPSITEAFYKKDYQWLKKLFNKLIFFNSIIIVLLIILSFYLNEITRLWMGENYNFPTNIIILSSVLHIFFLVGATLSTILYATNYLRSQIVVGTIMILTKIILVYVLIIKEGLAFKGILISSLVCFIIYTFFNLFYFIKKFNVLWIKKQDSFT